MQSFHNMYFHIKIVYKPIVGIKKSKTALIIEHKITEKSISLKILELIISLPGEDRNFVKCAN